MHNYHQLFSMNNFHYVVSNTLLLIQDKLFSIANAPNINYLSFIDGPFPNSLGSQFPSELGSEILPVTLITD